MTHSCWSPPGSWSVARRYRCTEGETPSADRKSTRLNSSHITISYAVFCLKKKKKTNQNTIKNPKVRKHKVNEIQQYTRQRGLVDSIYDKVSKHVDDDTG